MSERKDLGKVATLAAMGVAAAGCMTVARRVVSRDLPAEPTVPDKPEFELRAMNRLAFGPLPDDLNKLRAKGYAAYLEEQLNPAQYEDPVLEFQLSRLDVIRVGSAELRDLPQGEVARQLRQATLLRMLYSPWQLRERMVDFWTNHFNILAEKGDNAYRKPVDDLNVIRQNALGKFPELIKASAQSSAMLGYLNNDVNKKGVPNENYARELMELHTLGVHGGYTQQDIKEVARCLTGWTVEKRFLHPKDRFRFDPDVHDTGSKFVLGHAIAENGEAEGDQVIGIVTHHPSTAKFICGKLCRYFLGDADHPAHVEAEKIFRSTRGDIKSVLKTILAEDNLRFAKPIVKRPIDFVASSLRVIGAESDGNRPIHNHLEAMGQPLFGWPMPDGYPDKTAAWTGSLLARWNFAWSLANGGMPGTWFDKDRVKGRERLLALGHHERPQSGSAPIELACALADPAFQWR